MPQNAEVPSKPEARTLKVRMLDPMSYELESTTFRTKNKGHAKTDHYYHIVLLADISYDAWYILEGT